MASKQLVDLTPGTSYAIQVRSVGNGGYSDWSPSYVFVTPGNPVGTTNTSQSMRLANGSVIYAGSPPASALVNNPTVGTGSSALVMSNNTFTSLKSNGDTLFKIDVPNDSLYINTTSIDGGSKFLLDTSASTVLTIGTTGNYITMDNAGNVVVNNLTANSISLTNGDFWNNTGFQLGGGNGIAYTTGGTIIIGNGVTNGLTMDSSGNTTFYGTLNGVDGNFSGSLLIGSDYWKSDGTFRLGGTNGITYNGTALNIGSNVTIGQLSNYATTGALATTNANVNTLQNKTTDFNSSGDLNGALTLTTSGSIYANKTSYIDTTAGWYIGWNSSNYPAFHFGGPTSYIKWDAQSGTLAMTGSISASTISGGSITGTYIYTSAGAYGITITGGNGTSDLIRFTNTVGDATIQLGAGTANAFNISGPGQTPYIGGITIYGTGTEGVPNTIISRNPLRIWADDPNLVNNTTASIKSAKNITIAHFAASGTPGTGSPNFNGDIWLQYTP